MPGLCECGCGRPAPISDRTDTKRGYVKGQPLRFINGHQRRGRTRVAASGERYGRLTVVQEAEPYRTIPGKPARRVLCSCECGSSTVVAVASLADGRTQSCGCIIAERRIKASEVFGSLTVIREVEGRQFASQRMAQALCRCDCGVEVVRLVCHLRSGGTTSCGCKVRIHGHAGAERTPTYISWMSMRARCTNPNHRDYRHYGGRGITVCDRWIDSFENFLADMGERPSGTTIDRIDNDAGYELGNCRWADAVTQRRNRRDYAGAV